MRTCLLQLTLACIPFDDSLCASAQAPQIQQPVAEAEVAQEPKKAPAQHAREAESTGLVMWAAHSLVLPFHKQVQEELKLSDEQKQKLQTWMEGQSKEAQKTLKELDGAKTGMELSKVINPFRQKTQEQLAGFLKDTLKPDQHKRLGQLRLQTEGFFALDRNDVNSDLKLTAEQLETLVNILPGKPTTIQALIKEARSGAKPEAIVVKLRKKAQNYQGTLEGILTDTQKKKWKEMLGKPFDFGDR